MSKLVENLTTLQIMQLERRLEHQTTVRCSLEKALGCKSFLQNITQTAMSKVAPPDSCGPNDALLSDILFWLLIE